MFLKTQTYSLPVRLVVLITFLSFHEPASSLDYQDTVSVPGINPHIISYHNSEVTVGPYGSLYKGQKLLDFSGEQDLTGHPIYLDSLKVKASKNLLTRKLYDLVIVSPHKPLKISNEGESQSPYSEFTGKKIRNINVTRLGVFGTSIREPETQKPDKIENVLNKTHINTLEAIIRKNLLFRSGDVISPLLLSDNERILRQLSYIDDARIVVIPVSDTESDILVLTKDIYSLAASYNYGGMEKGTLSVFEKNIFGMGHEFGVEIPFDTRISSTPGFGAYYKINNISRSFINLHTFFLDDLREKSYGITLNRMLVSSTTKYAGGLSIIQMHTTEDLGSLPVPELLRYNFQDYWLSRSFLIDRQSVSRIVIGARYTHNNIFNRPEIGSESFHELQNYRLYLASAAFSVQRYYKANHIYGYGRTEDIPYGGLIKFTAGNEINEFKQRYYFGSELAVGKKVNRLGYIYASVGLSSFLNEGKTEQGMVMGKLNHFSDMFVIGRNLMRLFVNLDYTKGFNRYTDEHLLYHRDNGFSGFRNDSVTGIDRLALGLESVLFSPANVYGFRFAFFGFADYSFLAGKYRQPQMHSSLSSIGIGIRVRNDNLLFNTIQIRIAYYPNPPEYSRINNVIFSGEQLLRPSNFDPGPPSVIFYR